MRKRIFYSIILLWVTCVSANTVDTLALKQQQLSNIEQQTSEKKSVQSDLQNKLTVLHQQLRQGAEAIQKQESLILEISQDIARIQTQQRTLKRLLQQKTADLGALIPIAQHIDKHKNIALFLSPDTPKQSMMAIRLLQHIMPQIEQKRQAIINTYDRFHTLQTHLIEKQTALQQQHHRIQQSRIDLQQKITAYNTALHRDAKIIAKLQQQHQTLQQQVSQLKHALKQAKDKKNRLKNRHIRPENIRLFPTPTENTPITAPVIGTIVATFEQPLKNGDISDGIYVKTLPNAQVVAPFDGYVAFVGAFPNLGKIVLIAHERGYNSVLIGFDDIFVQNNDWVLEKDPIGTTNTQAKPFKIEIRYGTKTENPLLWITESRN